MPLQLICTAASAGAQRRGDYVLARHSPFEWEHDIYTVDRTGVLHVLSSDSHNTTKQVIAQFELYVLSEELLPTRRPLHKDWSCMEIVHQDGPATGVLFSQKGSKKLLFSQLPEAVEGSASGVFLFGTHAGEVQCLTCNTSYAVSGCDMATVKLWGLKEGSLLDVKGDEAMSTPRVSAVHFIGPLMFAAGNSEGQVVVYDISSHKMMAVQRFFVDMGPVTVLAGCVAADVQRSIALAEGPRSADGGGVVLPPAGLPWRLSAEGSTNALLAVGSSAGWLHIFQPSCAGEAAWERQYSDVHNGSIRLKFSPEGDYLALSSGIASGTIVLLDTTSWIAVQQLHFPSPAIDIGFWPAPAGQSLTTVAASRMAPHLSGADLVGVQVAVRLQLYAAFATDLPAPMQVTLPIHMPKMRSPQRAALAGLPPSFHPPPPQPTPEALWQGGARYNSSSMQLPAASSPPAASRQGELPTYTEGGSCGDGQLPAASSPATSKAGSADTGSSQVLGQRSSLRPSTMPIGRSWKYGGAPRIDFGELGLDARLFSAGGSGTPLQHQNQLQQQQPQWQQQQLAVAQTQDVFPCGEAVGAGEPIDDAEGREEEEETEEQGVPTLWPMVGQSASWRFAAMEISDADKSDTAELSNPKLLCPNDLDLEGERQEDGIHHLGTQDEIPVHGTAHCDGSDADNDGGSAEEAAPVPRVLAPTPYRSTATMQSQDSSMRGSYHRMPLEPNAADATSADAARADAARADATSADAARAHYDDEQDHNLRQHTSRPYEGVDHDLRYHRFEQAAYFGDQLSRMQLSDVGSEDAGQGGGFGEAVGNDDMAMTSSQGGDDFALTVDHRTAGDLEASGQYSPQKQDRWVQDMGRDDGETDNEACDEDGVEGGDGGGDEEEGGDERAAQEEGQEEEEEGGQKGALGGTEDFLSDVPKHATLKGEGDTAAGLASATWAGGYKATGRSARGGARSASLRMGHQHSTFSQRSAAQPRAPHPQASSRMQMHTPAESAPGRGLGAFAQGVVSEAPQSASAQASPNVHGRALPKRSAGKAMASPGYPPSEIDFVPSVPQSATSSVPQSAASSVPRFMGYKPNMATLLNRIRRRTPTKPASSAAVTPVRASSDDGYQGGVPGRTVRERQHRYNNRSGATTQTSVGSVDVQQSMESVHGRQQQHAMRSEVHGSMASPQVLMGSPPSLPMGSAEYMAAAGCAALQQPSMFGTTRLMRKMEALLAAEPPGQVNQARVEEAEQHAATVVSNVPISATIYHQLPTLDMPPPPSRPQKQLHPGWLATRQSRPDIHSLWHASEEQRGVCETRGVDVWQRPTPLNVAAAILALQ